MEAVLHLKARFDVTVIPAIACNVFDWESSSNVRHWSGSVLVMRCLRFIHVWIICNLLSNSSCLRVSELAGYGVVEYLISLSLVCIFCQQCYHGFNINLFVQFLETWKVYIVLILDPSLKDIVYPLESSNFHESSLLYTLGRVLHLGIQMKLFLHWKIVKTHSYKK